MDDDVDFGAISGQRFIDGIVDNFVHQVVKKILLADGDLTAAETGWLTHFLTQDGPVDDADRLFLRDLKTGAKRTSPEFDALFKKHVG